MAYPYNYNPYAYAPYQMPQYQVTQPQPQMQAQGAVFTPQAPTSIALSCRAERGSHALGLYRAMRLPQKGRCKRKTDHDDIRPRGTL